MRAAALALLLGGVGCLAALPEPAEAQDALREWTFPTSGMFPTNKSSLKPELESALAPVAEDLRANSWLKVVVEVHSDSMGSAKYNQILTQDRAEAIVDYLVGQGVQRSQLAARGYGEGRPIASNDSSSGRSKNRRIQIVQVIGGFPAPASVAEASAPAPAPVPAPKAVPLPRPSPVPDELAAIREADPTGSQIDEALQYRPSDPATPEEVVDQRLPAEAEFLCPTLDALTDERSEWSVDQVGETVLGGQVTSVGHWNRLLEARDFGGLVGRGRRAARAGAAVPAPAPLGAPGHWGSVGGGLVL